MKKLVFILLILNFFGCKSENDKSKIFYYPSESKFDNRLQFKKIDLDTTRLTYLDIFRLIPGEDFRKYAPLFEISEGSMKKRILPFVVSSYNRRNILTVTKDSIFADKSYRIEQLDSLMNEIFQNNGSSKFYNDDFQYIASVAVKMKGNSSGKEIKQLLLRITKVFDKIEHKQQDSLFLRIYFDVPLDYNPIREKE